jgi:GT2 family glycosyltransferase
MPDPAIAPSPSTETVCAVIPTYNCKQPLVDCLEVVRRQTRPVAEIIVVDNASTDGTREMIEEKYGGCLTYVRLPENVGGAGGFNQGMRLACDHGHQWIWCLDSDALPTESTLEELLSAEWHSGVPTVAKTCIFRDPASGELHPGGALRRFSQRKNSSFARPTWEGKIVSVQTAILCCLLVRADAARQAGFVKPGLFIYFDDTFFSKELKSQGEIIQVGTVIVTHPMGGGQYITKWGSRRFLVQDYWRTYYFFRNGILFEMQYYNPGVTLVRFAYFYFRKLFGILLLDDHKLYRMELLTKGVWDGLLGRSGKLVEPGGVDSNGRRRKHPAS